MSRSFTPEQILYKMVPVPSHPTAKCVRCDASCAHHHALISNRFHVCAKCEIQLQEFITGGPRSKNDSAISPAAAAYQAHGAGFKQTTPPDLFQEESNG